METDDEHILVFCAHSDDQVFGPGGTIARYAKEGRKVKTIIFSYGEKSHFWLKRKVSVEMRVEESKEADRILGGDGVIFLGLEEGKFREQFKEKDILTTLRTMIRDYKPTKVFTHSPTELHPDHKDVFHLVKESLDTARYAGSIYCFEVWNNFLFHKRDESAKMFVDITDYFNIKIKALKVFRSQKLALITLLWSVYLKAILAGFNVDSRYAEKFYVVK